MRSQHIQDLLSAHRPAAGTPIGDDATPYCLTTHDRRTRPLTETLNIIMTELASSPHSFTWRRIEDPLIAHSSVQIDIGSVPATHNSGHSVFGKGPDLLHALVSAGGEALERVRAWPTSDEYFVVATCGELLRNKVPAVDPSQFCLPSAHSSSHVPYHHDLPMRWGAGWCVLSQGPVAVPRSFTHILETDDRSELIIDNLPNGSAAGNCATEATIHGISELVERDAVAIFTYHRLPAREIDLASIRHPTSQELCDALVRAGLRLALHDYTTDLRLPVVYAVAWDPRADSTRGPAFAWGAGCSLNPEVAVLRSLTEVCQDRATAVRLMRWAESAEKIQIARSMVSVRGFGDFLGRCYPGQEGRFEYHFRSRGTVGLDELKSASAPPASPTEELAILRERLREGGLERLVVVELTPPGAAMAVVRAISPDLEFMPWLAASDVNTRRRRAGVVPTRLGLVEGRDYAYASGLRTANLLV